MQSTRMPRRTRDVARPAAFLAAMVILIAATAVMHFQLPAPDPFVLVEGWSWWQYPIERNAFQRLPVLSGDPHLLYVLPNSTHAWVGSGFYERPFVMHSADRGVTWERISNIDPSVEIRNINFIDPSHGWLLGAQGELLETRDGGRSWNKRILGKESYSALARSGQRLIAGGGGGWSVSNDAGANWQNHSLAKDITCLDASPDGRFWAGTRDGSILSSDDGASWTLRSKLPHGFLSDISFTDVQHGFVASPDAASMKTVDGGATWQPLPPTTVLSHSEGVTESVVQGTYAVENFGDSSHRIALAGYGQIFLRTGGPWRRVTRSNTLGVAFHADRDGRHVWMVGDRGIILASDDGGATWIPLRSSTQGDLTGIVFVPGGERGWAISNSGEIVRTTDHGRTWARVHPQGAEPYSRRIAVSDDGLRVVAQYGLKSNDGGTLWTEDASVDQPPSGTSERAVHSGGKQMWKFSELGVPLRSTDGGVTWIVPRYERYPAPWYYLALLPVALMLFVSMRTPAPVARAERSIEDVPWNDKPLAVAEADRLGCAPLAHGIARFLGNPKTEPPLTIAITGRWGSGKSSLMNLVAEGVKRYDYRPVWFNAWHYQSEEHLLPAILESIRSDAVPRWWTFRGLEFRMRLLLVRGMKNWLPALAILAVFVTTAAYFMRDPGAVRQFAENLTNLGAAKNGQFFESAGLLLSTLFSLVVVVRSLNAFGVSGTKITSFLSGSVRLADAGGKTGFRHQFAQAFGEVTRALGNTRLVLFIDDLDRCHSDHVLSVLECINFLVTSGDCFVIAGMDRVRVERCVAVRFEEESKTAGADEESPAANGAVDAMHYAQRYLEKLLNIEVPVPRPEPEQSRDLFAGPAPYADKARVRATTFGGRLAAVGQIALPWAIGAAVLAVAAHLGYFELFDRYHPPPIHAAVEARVLGLATTVPNPNAPAPPPANVSRPEARLIPSGVKREHEVLPIAGIALILAFGIVRLSLERANLEHDSDDFRLALRQWHPMLYFGANATPRSMKRCVNRVRYYAMRQRTNPLPPTIGERLGRLFSKSSETSVRAALEIPETILVPVSVVEHVFPQWLDDDAFWKNPAGYVESQPKIDRLGDGIKALREQGSIENYRAAFTRISAGIRLR
jgi:photosystem II stability/assembly factor-like uncharacterized protein